MYSNARGIKSKYPSLLYNVNKLKQDIICLCETWLTNNDYLELHNYNYFKLNRTNKKGGGLCLFVTKKYKTVIIDKDDENEIIWVKK